MKRPWQTWALFALFTGVVLAAMGWISAEVLRLEAANRSAQLEAAREETVRLALWRMDSAVAPLVIEESARPHYEYAAFNSIAAIYPGVDDGRKGGPRLPSPLLVGGTSNVLLYFDAELPVGKEAANLASPQVPVGADLDLARDEYGVGDLVVGNAVRLADFQSRVTVDDLQRAVEAGVQAPPEQQQDGQASQQQVAMNVNGQAGELNQARLQQQMLNVNEYSVRRGQTERAQSTIQSAKQLFYGSPRQTVDGLATVPGEGGESAAGTPQPRRVYTPPVEEGVMRPMYVNRALLLARAVSVGGRRHIQGAWLDWERLRGALLDEVRDLLPEADVVLVEPGEGVGASRMMASLPARLLPGTAAGSRQTVASPLRLPLLLAWGCALLAVSAVAALLVGAVRLSERRGAFVSAVTHELRTPLTTFRMYSEMLAEGMVTDADKRERYLKRLCSEANRLSHLVENVLSYARLERGRHTAQVETLLLSDAIERVRDRLADRCAQAGMSLAVGEAPVGQDVRVCADVSALEHVLLNLVDNACKYAAEAEDRRVHLECGVDGAFGRIRVCDHGPGIDRAEAARLFKPFRKSAKHAAETAPGVGLGLALSRRLARRMRGRLRIAADVDRGAAFDLLLPRAPGN